MTLNAVRGTGVQRFRAIGTTVSILASDAGQLDVAVDLTRRYLDRLDRAASRFRPDSELSRLNAKAARGDATLPLSPMFTGVLEAAIRTAKLTDGLVDPTVGAALQVAGYDADLTIVQGRPSGTTRRQVRPVGWRALRLDTTQRLISMPTGTVLDLGASAKAFAADEIAAALAAELRGGFLVDLGGDIAIGGALPRDGWSIGVELADGRLAQTIRSWGQAVATSSTQLRTWRTRDGETAHHIIDPRSGAVADSPWAQVTCCAATALEANAATTAAIVLGVQAPQWLADNKLPALLLAHDGRQIRAAGWPPAQEQSTR